MSASKPPTQLDSDSEDDPDFVPPVDDVSSSDSDDERDMKRTRVTSLQLTEEDKRDKSKAREMLWAEFQTSVSTPSLPEPEGRPKMMVKIEKRFRFAGEDVIEVKEVPEESDEAKKWPRWNPARDENSLSQSSLGADTPISQPQGEVPPATKSPELLGKPTSKRLGPRKPKTLLAALPSSSAQKVKKLSTLDKSAMDWRAHLESQTDPAVNDELETNRKSGGYLEKVAFLERVGERKDAMLESGKAGKRRRE